MPAIIIKGKSSSFNKDVAHQERKQIEQDLRGTILSKDKMWQMDCKSEHDEVKRVQEYDNWKNTRGRDGKTNAEKMDRLTTINQEFKKHGIEGREHHMDEIRSKKKVIYE